MLVACDDESGAFSVGCRDAVRWSGPDAPKTSHCPLICVPMSAAMTDAPEPPHCRPFLLNRWASRSLHVPPIIPEPMTYPFCRYSRSRLSPAAAPGFRTSRPAPRAECRPDHDTLTSGGRVCTIIRNLRRGTDLSKSLYRSVGTGLALVVVHQPSIRHRVNGL